MTLALVARCDNGGLGTMCWEAWRHLRPARTLVVRCAGAARGAHHPERYTGEVRRTPGYPTKRDAEWLLDGATVVYSAETWYGPAIPTMARRRGVRTALHVMPEYWTPQAGAELLLAPTSWRMPPRSRLLPVPVARDRFERRHINGVETLYHVVSPINDRNGTALVLTALAELRRPCRILIRHQDATGRRVERYGRARVEWLGHHDGPYWQAWPDDADALLLPRRYAGLSLPMQEAAALGLPIITLDRPPESDWFPAESRSPAQVAGQVVTMRGCQVDTWATRPADLATTIDTLLADPDLAGKLSDASDAWASTIDWPLLLPAYHEALDP